jgi:hypothetical protein
LTTVAVKKVDTMSLIAVVVQEMRSTLHRGAWTVMVIASKDVINAIILMMKSDWVEASYGHISMRMGNNLMELETRMTIRSTSEEYSRCKCFGILTYGAFEPQLVPIWQRRRVKKLWIPVSHTSLAMKNKY